MSIYIGDKEIKDLCIGDGSAKEIYLGDVKVRPSTTPITTPGIYHRPSLGLISLSSDGSARTTIADKNLGWANNDVIAYQFGNNYGFVYSSGVPANTTSQVSISSGTSPSTYNSSTFINRETPYAGSYTNLWGYNTDTNAAKKGPCPDGYHVPSITEMDQFINILSGLGVSNPSQYLFPLGSSYIGTVLTGYDSGVSWRSSGTFWNLSQYNKQYNVGGNAVTSYTSRWGYQIRPFKNDAVQPDSSRTKLN